MKVNYNGMTFDSELEMNFWIYLNELAMPFMYQDKFRKTPIQINLGRRKTYVPDFIVVDVAKKTFRIIELKGYAKWTANEDNNIMDFMKNKVLTDKQFLIEWLTEIGVYEEGWDVDYQRLKHLKGVGFVDYNYKNPNTIANKRKQKITELESENKDLREYKKNAERYFSYCKKIAQRIKLTKPQQEWMKKFEKENIGE